MLGGIGSSSDPEFSKEVHARVFSEDAGKGDEPETVGGDSEGPESKSNEAKEPGGEAGSDAEGGQAAGAGELRPLDVYAVLHVCIAQLASVAWQQLGLQADPITKEVHKDIPQARIAVDAVALLFDKLAPQLQGQEARDYRNLLTDLRLNFVKQSEEQPKAE
jgi:hypothetical protein